MFEYIQGIHLVLLSEVDDSDAGANAVSNLKSECITNHVMQIQFHFYVNLRYTPVKSTKNTPYKQTLILY